MKKIAILQSNYIPWKGYFDLIAAVDEFIIYDDVQYTRRDWRNRNLIKTPQGLQWLTVPVQVKGQFEQTIRDTVIDGEVWVEQHWKTLLLNYKRSAHFAAVAAELESLYLGRKYSRLSELNRTLLEWVCRWLGISTKISNAWEYQHGEGKTERLADLCRQAGGAEYISGPSAKNYIDESVFNKYGIKLSWFDYTGYPVYPQLWGEFAHNVTILDLLFNTGREAPRFMRYVRD